MSMLYAPIFIIVMSGTLDDSGHTNATLNIPSSSDAIVRKFEFVCYGLILPVLTVLGLIGNVFNLTILK